MPGSVESIELTVSKLEKVREFYRQLVGLDALESSGTRVALGADSDTAPIVILNERPDAAPRNAAEAGLFHLAVRFPNRPALGAVLRRLETHDYPLMGASDHDVSEALYLTDPAGNGVELYTDRPKQTWRRNAEGEVDMTTKRLDLESIRRAGRDNSGDRAPKETDLGHVHLEVTDLEKSLEFYTRILGMDLQASRPGAAFVSYGEYHHHVGLNTWNGRQNARSPETLGVSRIDARVARGTESHIRNRATGQDDELTEKLIELRDPDGLLWRFSSS